MSDKPEDQLMMLRAWLSCLTLGWTLKPSAGEGQWWPPWRKGGGEDREPLRPDVEEQSQTVADTFRPPGPLF